MNAQSDGRGSVPSPVDGLLDINLLPDRYRRRWPTPGTVLAWLIMLALLGLLVASYGTYQSANQRHAAARAELVVAQERLEATDPLLEQMDALRAEIQTAEERIAFLEGSAQALDIQQIAWGVTLRRVLERAPDGLRVAIVSQDGGSVELRGTAEDYYLPIVYAAALRESQPAPIVNVQEIRVLVTQPEPEGAETPTPAPTATPEPEAEEQVEVNFAFTIRLDYPQTQPDTAGSDEGGGQ